MSRLFPCTLVLLVACSGGTDHGAAGGDVYDYATSEGAALYAEMCAVCHGEIGEGGLGPRVGSTALSRSELTERIEATMPQADPGACVGACAASIAEFIERGLSEDALACDGPRPSRRQLRLLTRAEYAQSIRDVFAAEGASACTPHTFRFDPAGAGHTTVHVAGSFNDWAATVADGGWPLSYDANAGAFVGAFDVPAGRHTYKLVLDDDQWIADPANSTTEPDGFGGANSVLDCGAASDGLNLDFDLTAGIPAEVRPNDFSFDGHAAAALVTPVHLDAYVATATRVANEVVANLDAVVQCDYRADRAGCATSLVTTLGRRLFRRPLTSDERARYTDLIAAPSSFADGVSVAVQSLLVSPNFLYRSEVGAPAGPGVYRLTGYEVASALSYTLLGTTPSPALLDAAERGELDDAEGIERQARALLADPRSRATVARFGLQWLGAEDVLTVDKNADLSAALTPTVRAAMAEETRRLMSHVVFDSTGSFTELFTADYTFANSSLANLYGMSGVTGDALAHHPYPDDQRAGVLSHGSVLATYAHSDQTSPIRRGLFVRQQLLCQKLPPPPPEGGGVPGVDPNGTTRERFAQHSNDPVCAGCHQYIDGIGFGFERFDPIGRYREREGGAVIDAAADIADVERLGSGTRASFTTLPELARIVAESGAAQSCFVRQYYRFARGFEETLQNRCARLWLLERFSAADFDVRELIVSTFASSDFLERR